MHLASASKTVRGRITAWAETAKAMLLVIAWGLIRHRLPEPQSIPLTDAEMDALRGYLCRLPRKARKRALSANE